MRRGTKNRLDNGLKVMILFCFGVYDDVVLHPLSFLSRVPGSSPNEKALPSRDVSREVTRGRKPMAHSHGYEYQIKIVHEDATEELSGWMNNEAQVAQVMAAVHRPQGNTYWLRERTVVCPNCLDREQRILEYPFADIPSQRCLCVAKSSSDADER